MPIKDKNDVIEMIQGSDIKGLINKLRDGDDDFLFELFRYLNNSDVLPDFFKKTATSKDITRNDYELLLDKIENWLDKNVHQITAQQLLEWAQLSTVIAKHIRTISKENRKAISEVIVGDIPKVISILEDNDPQKVFEYLRECKNNDPFEAEEKLIQLLERCVVGADKWSFAHEALAVYPTEKTIDFLVRKAIYQKKTSEIQRLINDNIQRMSRSTLELLSNTNNLFIISPKNFAALNKEQKLSVFLFNVSRSKISDDIYDVFIEKLQSWLVQNAKDISKDEILECAAISERIAKFLETFKEKFPKVASFRAELKLNKDEKNWKRFINSKNNKAVVRYLNEYEQEKNPHELNDKVRQFLDYCFEKNDWKFAYYLLSQYRSDANVQYALKKALTALTNAFDSSVFNTPSWFIEQTAGVVLQNRLTPKQSSDIALCAARIGNRELLGIAGGYPEDVKQILPILANAIKHQQWTMVASIMGHYNNATSLIQEAFAPALGNLKAELLETMISKILGTPIDVQDTVNAWVDKVDLQQNSSSKLIATMMSVTKLMSDRAKHKLLTAFNKIAVPSEELCALKQNICREIISSSMSEAIKASEKTRNDKFRLFRTQRDPGGKLDALNALKTQFDAAKTLESAQNIAAEFYEKAKEHRGRFSLPGEKTTSEKKFIEYAGAAIDFLPIKTPITRENLAQLQDELKGQNVDNDRGPSSSSGSNP